MDLTQKLAGMARRAGAAVVGVAPVERFSGAPKGHHPSDLLPGATSVLTFGIRLLDRVLEWSELVKDSPFLSEDVRLEVLSAFFYQRVGYDIVNDRLNQVALTLANHLEELGHASVFFPATHGQALDQSRLGVVPGFFSQRHAAVRAGLGEFGLSDVVVTPRHGPRIRFNSVITTARLDPSPLRAAKLCRGTACRTCVNECPAEAISVLPEAEAERVWLDPVSRTDWERCRQKLPLCRGRCLRVCPVGRP